MISSNQNKDISLSNNNTKFTELVEVNSNDNTEYINLNNSGITSTSEHTDINDDEDFKKLKEQFNNTLIKDKTLTKEKTIKYRKGNLHTFLYDNKGNPRIVIGPDCKNIYFY